MKKNAETVQTKKYATKQNKEEFMEGRPDRLNETMELQH